MTTKIRKFIQVLFLGVFLFAMVLNKAQFWMGFIFISIILAAFFGRFYCGFACPINTLMHPVALIGKKLGMQKKPAVVDTTHCLLCFECKKICPTKAMSYK